MSDTAIHKQSWKKLIVSKGKWYIFSSLFTKGLGILLLPVYTRYLSLADYGVLSVLNSIGQLLPILISLQIDGAFGRYFHEDKVDHQRLRKLFSTTYWFIAIYGGVIVAISLVSSSIWVGYFAQVPFPYLLLTFIPALLMQLGQLGTIYLRQSLNSRRTTFLEVGTALLSIGITLPLLIIFNMGVLAKLIGSAFAATFILAYYSWYFIKKNLLGFEWDFQVLRRSLIYSLPLLPSVVAGWISGSSDRLMLAKYVSVESVGIYSLAATLATLLYVIQDALTQVTGPISMSGLVHEKQKTLNKIAYLSLLMWALMLGANLSVVLFSPEIIAIFATKKYAASAALIGICGFAYVVSSQYRIFMDILSLHNKTWLLSLTGLLAAALSGVLNLLLIPRFGTYGAATAFVVSVAFNTGSIVFCAMRFEYVKVEWNRMILLSILFIVGSSFSMFISDITIQNIFWKIVILLSFAQLAYLVVRHRLKN